MNGAIMKGRSDPSNSKGEIVTVRTIARDEAERSLHEYLVACRRHKWLIVLVVVSFTVAAAAWSLLQTPLYLAKATVVIENQGQGWLDRDKPSYLDNSPEYFQTHFELLKSHLVLQRTAQLIKLADRPEYQPQPSAITNFFKKALPRPIQGLWPSDQDKEPQSAQEVEEGLLRRFEQNIEILPIRGARLAHVTVYSIDPNFAAQAANTLLSVYIERTQEVSANSKEQAAQWYIAHLKELREKVEASQEALYLFRAKHGLLTGEVRKSVAAQTVSELNVQHVKVEMAKAEAQSRLQQIRSVFNGEGSETKEVNWSKLDSHTQVLNSPLIQALRTQEITVSSQVAELSEKYGPLHPKLANMKAELQDLRQRIQQEVRKIYDSIQHQYELAVAQERAVKDAIARHNADKIRLEQNEIEHGILEREAESSQHLYEAFLKTTKEADLSAGMRANNVYIGDPATPSSLPAKPKTKLNIMLALMAGLMSGIGLAIFLEGRNEKLMVPDDVERYIPNVSLLGVVPLMDKPKNQDQTMVHPNALTPAAESFRIIRTSVLLSKPETLPSRILIASPQENEGKTTLAVNLAMAMAQLETRVVLVDMDFRNQHPHAIFKAGTKDSPAKGLSNLLQGKADISEVVHESFVSNLWVIPRGDRPKNPTELLHAKSLAQLLDWGQQNNYHVILDCPPVLPFADAAVLASKVDGVLMVVSAGETTRESCRQAIQRMNIAGGKLLGIVMQKARVPNYPYYYSAYQ
jgi:capsular exopolysaccharide synthesis family protein